MSNLKEIKIFISYASEDRENNWLDNIKNNCLDFNSSQNIKVWDDGHIKLGQHWDDLIKNRLNEAHIVLLLISKDFLRSDYINNVELTNALKRHEEKKCTVIPVFIRHCSLADYPQITSLQGFPNKELFFSDMGGEIDRYYTELEHKIKNVLTDIRTREEMEIQVEDNTGAKELMKQENALPVVILTYSNSALGSTMKDFFLSETEREKKYKGWKFDVEECMYGERVSGNMHLSEFHVHVIASEQDIVTAGNMITESNETYNYYKKAVLWISDASLEEKLPVTLRTNKIVVATRPAQVIEMIHLMEKERLEFMSTAKNKFSQQVNIYMLYDFERDHNNLLRINLKEKLENNSELLTFYNPPNPTDSSIEEQLKLSKGAIIFYGTADTNWYCSWQSRIQKISSLKSKAVCISEPEKMIKLKRDVSRRAFLVMDDEQKLDDYVSQFLNNLKTQS